MANELSVSVTAGSAPSVSAPTFDASGSTITAEAPEVTAGSAPAVMVSIPQFVADGISGDGSTRTLTFSSGAPPTDGSIGLCFVVIDDSTGLAYTTNAFQRLLYWTDNTVGLAGVTGVEGVDLVSVPSWSFVADANVSNQ
jgi:hypothetical protein